MGDFFGGLRSGIQFPQVVMNQGPLPGSGGLPQPLHETPDARINYNSSLLGDLTPYAYGEPGYLSSQNAYLNIPHKIQKIVPVVFLPEAKVGAKEFFDLSHPIDDGDLAFVLRLNRDSLFCTGLKNGDMRRAGLGTAIDPLINLCTLNYILSGMQLGVTHGPGDLWAELLYNLDPHRFARPVGIDSRDYRSDPINLGDLIHMVHHCIRPFGITRGSEKQGGQDEATISPATWPVSFVVSLTIDGKESNVMNLWHNHDLHAGNDLVLRMKLMPLRPYTLNHYYKGVKRQNWSLPDLASPSPQRRYVWQLVPDLLHLDMPDDKEMRANAAMLAVQPPAFRFVQLFRDGQVFPFNVGCDIPWQELGYWHIGRSQVMTGKYGLEEYWHNDLANALRTNHLDITFQPSFCSTPFVRSNNTVPGDVAKPYFIGEELRSVDVREQDFLAPEEFEHQGWRPALGLERIQAAPMMNLEPGERGGLAQAVEEEPWDASLGFGATRPAAPPEDIVGGDEEWMGRLESAVDDEPAAEVTVLVQADPPVSPPPVSVSGAAKKAASGASVTGNNRPTKRGRIAGGSLLKLDGTSETSGVEML